MQHLLTLGCFLVSVFLFLFLLRFAAIVTDDVVIRLVNGSLL